MTLSTKKPTISKRKNRQAIVEISTFRLGGVSLSVSATPGLGRDLKAFQNRMADFQSEGSPNLRLLIIRANPATEANTSGHQNDFINNVLVKPAEKESSKKKRNLLIETAERMELLMSDHVIGDSMKPFAHQADKVLFFPLKFGYLFANIEENEGLLILDEGRGRNNGADQPPGRVYADITALNGVMALLSAYLAGHRGGMVHGTGVCYRGEGYLFVAPSGGGKTTLSIQSPPGAVLADDGLIIREMGSRFFIFPSPFRQRPGGDIYQWAWHDSPVRLRALFLLVKGLDTRLRSISRAQALGILMNTCTHFFSWMKAKQATDLFDFWRDLSAGVPFARMEWRQGDDFWLEIGNYLNEGEQAYEKEERAPGLARGV